ASECNSARGNQDDLLVALTQPQEILDQGLEPGPVDAPGLGVDQQRRADLHDNAPGLLQGCTRRHRVAFARARGIFGNLSTHGAKIYAISRRTAREHADEYANYARVWHLPDFGTPEHQEPKRGRNPGTSLHSLPRPTAAPKLTRR